MAPYCSFRAHVHPPASAGLLHNSTGPALSPPQHYFVLVTGTETPWTHALWSVDSSIGPRSSGWIITDCRPARGREEMTRLRSKQRKANSLSHPETQSDPKNGTAKPVVCVKWGEGTPLRCRGWCWQAGGGGILNVPRTSH